MLLNYQKIWEQYGEENREAFLSAHPEMESLNPEGLPVDPKVLEDRRLREVHEQEFKEAKRKDEEMQKKQREDAAREKEETERRNREEEEQRRSREEALIKKKESIPEEPVAGDPEACEIAFRFPSGKRLIRRFPKSTAIRVLYNYIDCLEEEEVSEGKYELSQTMPKKAYKNMDATLDSESLYPKALVQIGVIDE